MLEVRHLACIRGDRSVFAGISFCLQPGDVLALRGPNGSGKSTLIRLLAGFLRPAMGEILWQDENIGTVGPDYRANLHYVGHTDGIKSLLSVRENLAFTCALNSADDEALKGALDLFNLAPLIDTPGRFLSSGQRRRLSLARLVAGYRPLWLLDEPGVGLDAANRSQLEGAIDSHRREGGIVILATHGDVEVAETLVLQMGC